MRSEVEAWFSVWALYVQQEPSSVFSFPPLPAQAPSAKKDLLPHAIVFLSSADGDDDNNDERGLLATRSEYLWKRVLHPRGGGGVPHAGRQVATLLDHYAP